MKASTCCTRCLRVTLHTVAACNASASYAHVSHTSRDRSCRKTFRQQSRSMCICRCMCIYMYAYVYMYIYTGTCTNTCTCTYTHTCTYACIHRSYRKTFWQQRQSMHPPPSTLQLLRHLLSHPGPSGPESARYPPNELEMCIKA